MKLADTFCEQHAKLLNVKAGVAYSYHYPVKG